MKLGKMNYESQFLGILAKGRYKNYEYRILNRSGMPTAYIKLPTDISSNEVLKIAIESALVVHGGITFTGSLDFIDNDHSFIGDYWIGWDYGHAGDYMHLNQIVLSGQR